MIELDRVDFVEMNRADFEYVWNNMRERDRQELALQGLTDKTRNKISQLRHRFIAKYDDKPIAVFGVSVRDRTVFHCFFATDEIKKHMKLFTYHAKLVIAYWEALYWGHHHLVYVWEKHTDSIRWLSLLGFRDCGRFNIINGERLIFMEKK